MSLRPTILTLSLLVSGAVASATATASVAEPPPMRFEHITLEQGLSQSNVFAILQDSDGLMWFATENGLNRYDGYDFEVFHRERGNAKALVSDYVYDIAEDGAGDLWIASNGGGLTKMDRGAKTFTTFRHDAADPNSISANTVRAVEIAADGTVWAGTRGAGLNRYNAKTNEFSHFRFSADEGGAADEIYALHLTGDILWIGTNDGLIRFDTKSEQSKRFSHNADAQQSLSGDKVRAIYSDSAGRLWVGTYASGLNLFNQETSSFTRLQHDTNSTTSLASDRVTAIFEDSANRLWVGTYAGLNLLDRATQTFSRFAHDAQDLSSLGDDAVTAVFEDRSGILWVGTRNQGLSRWNPRSWSYGLRDARALSTSGDREPNVTAFAEDAEGQLWVGTFGDGLHALDRDNDEQRYYRNDPSDLNSISDDRVMSLLLDSEGNLWAGTMTGGLNHIDLDTDRNTVYRHDAEDPHSISANGIMALLEDSQGQIWVGTFGGGISRFNPETRQFTRFNASSEGSLTSNRVTSFAEDAAGFVWIGTDAGGLNIYDPKTERFQHLRHDPDDVNTLAGDTVYSIHVDADQVVWVGTQGAGLDRVVGDPSKPGSIRFENVSQADGLPNDVIYGIQQDQTGVLWLSTNYGLSQFDPATGQVRNLHRADGLQSEEFNFGAHYRSDSGELFFGGHKGFNAFRPDRVEVSDVAPLIALTGVYRNGDRVKADTTDGIDFAHTDDNVSFEFAALDYANSARNQYRYKLEGFDKEWMDLGNRRRVTYTDLDNGSYLLRVQASNSYGVWNEAGLALPVRMSPAPWETWWAYLGYAFIALQVGGMLWLGHRRKLRREEEYSNRLECEVRERTERLVESNSRLKELNQALQESSLSDPLTGLRNRRFVFEEISRDLDLARRNANTSASGATRASEFVFMMIDLDNFKPINDTYGHAAGDQMLLEVRDVLLSTCRKSDFVVRWGGDEFVVIAKQAKPGEAEALAERIRKKIADHRFVLCDGQIVRTTCSIGFAGYPLFRGQVNEADLDQILGLADGLMYEAKRQRNAWAGMLTPTTAVTSSGFDRQSIAPTSLLFRAKHTGALSEHSSTGAHRALLTSTG